MVLKRKGLLPGCEQLFTPMSSDSEGHLRGGFLGISVTSYSAINAFCANAPCNNRGCGNIECTNIACVNGSCYVVTDEPTTAASTTTQQPHDGLITCGFL